MHSLSFIASLLAITSASAFQLPGLLSTRNTSSSNLEARQNVRDVTVNLAPSAADALASFFKESTTFFECPPEFFGPEPPSRRSLSNLFPFFAKRAGTTFSLAQCLKSVHEMAVSEVIKAQPLESMFTTVKEIIFNIEDSPTFKDKDVQKAHADALLAGAKMLEVAYPKIDSTAMNRITGALFLATHAKIVAKAAYFGYYSVEAAYLASNVNDGHCVGFAAGVDIACPNPYCKGENSAGCTAHGPFFGCPCKPFVCPDGDDVQYCDHCGGDDGSGHCKGDGADGKYAGCGCMKTKMRPPYIGKEHDFEPIGSIVDKLPRIGAWKPRDPSKANPECNGIDYGKWVTRDKVLSALGDFCNDAARRKSEGASDDDLRAGKITHDAHYNAGDRDELHLKLTYYSNMEMSKEECEKSITEISEVCDGTTSDNPTNTKHGGKYTLNKDLEGYAVFEFTPWRGDPRLDCNPLDSQTFMYPNTLVDDIGPFCNDAATSQYSLTEKKLHEGTPNEVILKVDWANQQTLKFTQVCIDAMIYIKEQCGGSTLLHGPFGGNDGPGDFKHGGTRVLDGRALFSIQPQKSTTCSSVPDMSCGGHDDCNEIQCPSGTDWYTGRCVDGKCGCALGNEGRIC